MEPDPATTPSGSIHGRTSRSERLRSDRPHYWHPFADMAAVSRDGELVLSHGHGSTVVDLEGQQLLDATAGLWFCAVGHGRTEIADAAAAQMSRLAAYSTFGDVAVDVTLDLAERLCALSPHPDGAAVLTSGGSDSVDSAIKLVLRYWEALGEPSRSTIVRRTNAYHGMHLGGTLLAGIEANRVRLADGGVRSVQVSWDDADELDELIRRLGPGNVAAFFCEPVIGAGGVFAAPEGYLPRVEQICREHGVLFVLDEVITGFGRLGRWFAAERFELSPDLITFAKGVTSGYLPLGGVIASPRVLEPFWSTPGAAVWRHGYTYSGHAAACAAAMANLDLFGVDSLLQRADELESVIARAVEGLVELPAVSEVRCGVGALAAVQLDPDRLAEQPSFGGEVVLAARRHGVLTRLLACGALQLSPPLCSTDDEIASMALGLRAALVELE